MLEVGQKGVGPNGARLEVVESSPGRVVVERLYKPRTGKALPHVHEDFEQRWAVLEGTATAVVGGEKRTAGPGDTIDVPRGVPHRDAWNASAEDLLVRFTLEPQTEFIAAFGAALMHHLEDGSTNRQDEIPQLHVFVLLHAVPNDSWAQGPPRALQRLTLPLMAGLGRLRGYRASY